MSRTLLILRLVVRDLRRRPWQAALLLVAIMAATTTLTMGLALAGVTSQPYQQTRTLTSGPDVVASYLDLPPMPRGATATAALAAMKALASAPGVTGHGGPYPVGWATLRAGKLTAGVMAEGRNRAKAAIDQPKLVQGNWVSSAGVVFERSFADALGVRVGQEVTLDNRPFRVAGIAVTAGNAPYPDADFVTRGTPFPSNECGMVWVSATVARSLASRILPLAYVLNLRLVDSVNAPAFAQAHSAGRYGVLAVTSWQQIASEDANLVNNAQRVLLLGSWLLSLLAVASVAVLVGGRIAEQEARRVGLLKAVGGTPGLVAAVLLAENLLLALAAAAAGLAVGWLAAPLLTSSGAGLVGTPGAPSLAPATVGWAVVLAVAVAMLATLVPAVRAARASTVSALADAARAPRRHRMLVTLSRRLPPPLLLGVRLADRRRRRSVLSGASVLVTATTVVAVLTVHAHQAQARVTGFSALANPRQERIDQVLLVLTITLAALAAVNAIFVTQAMAADTRHSSALTRALGATADQIAAALCLAQLIPAVPVLLGIPAGIVLVESVSHGAATTIPPAWWLVLMVAGTLIALVVLTMIPARASSRHSVAEILQAESA